jgi:hypothetical protein
MLARWLTRWLCAHGITHASNQVLQWHPDRGSHEWFCPRCERWRS